MKYIDNDCILSILQTFLMLNDLGLAKLVHYAAKNYIME